MPIITALTLSLVGLAIPFLWKYVAMGIAGSAILFRAQMFSARSCTASACCCSPFGLHHILLAMVRFTAGHGIC